MTRRIDQVYFDALPFDLSSLRQNCDPAFALLIVGIHDPINKGGVGAESARSAQQRINKCCFAMVYVRH